MKMLIHDACKYAMDGMFYRYKFQNIETGGTCDARYCYSVWMRHLIFYYEINNDLPCIVAEFGPGDTIGTGLMALLCGAENYYALDFIRYAGIRDIYHVLEQLLEMLQARENIPDDKEFPHLYPKLISYEFPHEILSDEFLRQCLDHARLNRIRRAVQAVKFGKESDMIHYLAPWWKENLSNVKCDMIFSQAVFEHIDEYEDAHKMIGTIAKHGAVISHEIDFSCHGCSEQWNGQWRYGRLLWKMIYGSRPYFLNRASLTAHIKAMKMSGIKIRKIMRTRGKDGILRRELCHQYRGISDRDLVTKNAYILGVMEK